jgi:hypothetical protein
MITNQRTSSLYYPNYTREQVFEILVSSFPDWDENQKIGIINCFNSGNCCLPFISYVLENLKEFDFEQHIYKDLIHFCLRLNLNYTVDLVYVDRSRAQNFIPYFVEYFIIEYILENKKNKGVRFQV